MINCLNLHCIRTSFTSNWLFFNTPPGYITPFYPYKNPDLILNKWFTIHHQVVACLFSPSSQVGKVFNPENITTTRESFTLMSPHLFVGIIFVMILSKPGFPFWKVGLFVRIFTPTYIHTKYV